jgi:hypothetical protein
MILERKYIEMTFTGSSMSEMPALREKLAWAVETCSNYMRFYTILVQLFSSIMKLYIFTTLSLLN